MSSSDSRKKLNRLAAQVLGDPLDANLVRTLGLALIGAGETKVAASALAASARGFAALGQLAMAIAVAKEIEPLDEALAERLVGELATAFGSGSKRVDAAHRRRPPKLRERDEPKGGATQPIRANPLEAVAASEAEVERLPRGPLPRFPLFNDLSPPAFARLVGLAEVREPAAGEVVVEVGSQGQSFFVIARGTIRIGRPGREGEEEVVLSHLRGGAFFGEMALLTESPRTARATCESDTVLLEIQRRGLEELAAVEQEFAAVLADYTRDRLLQNLMLTSGLFAPLDEPARARLIERFEIRTFDGGEALLEEGAEGGTLFVVLSGEVAIEKREGDDVLTVTRLGPGDVVGEISLLTRRPATATVRAYGRTIVLGLLRDDFNAIVGDFPAVLAHLYQLAVAREQDLERFLSDTVIEADDYLI